MNTIDLVKRFNSIGRKTNNAPKIMALYATWREKNNWRLKLRFCVAVYDRVTFIWTTV